MNSSQPDLLAASTSDMSASLNTSCASMMSDCSRISISSSARSTSSRKNSKRVKKKKNKYRQLLTTTSMGSSRLASDHHDRDKGEGGTGPLQGGSFKTVLASETISSLSKVVIQKSENSRLTGDKDAPADGDEGLAKDLGNGVNAETEPVLCKEQPVESSSSPNSVVLSANLESEDVKAVSYTHLTLPTICSV